MGSMNLDLPTEGGDDDVWDTLINAALLLLEEHDHTSGNGVQIPSSGLDIDADLTFAGNAATNVKALSFAGVSSYTVAKSFFVDSDDNELYYRTNGGTNIQVTNGAALNLALVGGITGDYASTDADVEYVDAEKAFEFKQDETPDHWAKLKVGDIKVHETASGITNAVTVKSAGSLAASYDLTLPTAVPVGTSLVTMASTGALATTLTPPTVTALTASGAVQGATVTGTTSVTTAEGDIRHGETKMSVPLMFLQGAGDTPAVISSNRTYIGSAVDSNRFAVNLPLKVGDRIKRIDAIVTSNEGGRAVDMACYKHVLTGAFASYTVTQIGSTQTTGASTDFQTLSITGLTETVADGSPYTVQFEIDAGASTHRVYALYVTYDRVA